MSWNKLLGRIRTYCEDKFNFVLETVQARVIKIMSDNRWC